MNDDTDPCGDAEIEIEIDAPEGATDEEILAMVRRAVARADRVHREQGGHGLMVAGGGRPGHDPDLVIVWDTERVTSDQYARLVEAIGDLARAEGALGIERIGTEPRARTFQNTFPPKKSTLDRDWRDR